MSEKHGPPPFAPSNQSPEKRPHQYNLRFTDAEKALLEREAEKCNVTPLNWVRALIAERLRKKPRR